MALSLDKLLMRFLLAICEKLRSLRLIRDFTKNCTILRVLLIAKLVVCCVFVNLIFPVIHVQSVCGKIKVANLITVSFQLKIV